MKKSTLTILITLCIISVFAQRRVFQNRDNGLIYSNEAIQQLSKIVDSLNRSFAASDLNQTYYSRQQALGHFVKVSKEHVREAEIDFTNNISYEDFLKKYPNAEIDDNLLIIKTQYKDYEGNDMVSFSNLEFKNNKSHTIEFENQTELYSKKLHHSWVFEYSESSKYSSESIEAFYFTEEFKSTPIPEKYANYIHYADYLIDTTSQVYFKNAYRSESVRTPEMSGNIQKFMHYFYEETNRPNPVDFGNLEEWEDFEKYSDEYLKWDSLMFSFIDQNLANSKKFNKLLKKAYQEAVSKGGSNDELEDLVGLYLSKEKELLLRRNRIVVGGCSYDCSPRDHTFKIAELSAETLNWHLFLRSHLDLMNDNIERNIDANYAEKERETYIRELEEIKINTPNLLLGILLRIENSAPNHYYGDIGRVGRALAESKYLDEIENKMLHAIADNELDDYNRLMIYYLFLNYNYHIQDEERQENNLIRLQKAVNELPEYLSIRIQNENYQFERLLRNELNLIHQHFTISNPFFGYSSGSTDWDSSIGNCWSADLKDKNEPNNILFNVTMKYNAKPGSIQPLIEQKDSLLQRVHKALFLINLLKEDHSKKLLIHFTMDKSLSENAQKYFLRDLRESGKENLNYQLDNAIFLTLIKEYRESNWLLFTNGDIMLWWFGNDSPLEQYTREQLITSEKWDTSFKIFDENGNLKE